MNDWDREADMFETPAYPEEWTAEQRLAAYWYALNHCGLPSTTKGWLTVWNLIEREQLRRQLREESNP